MMLEIAILEVKAGQSQAFEAAFGTAQAIIRATAGYVSHELQRCLETKDRYVLLVRWQRLEDHTERFRKSPQYEDWRRQLHHFYESFPRVEHYQLVI